MWKIFFGLLIFFCFVITACKNDAAPIVIESPDLNLVEYDDYDEYEYEFESYTELFDVSQVVRYEFILNYEDKYTVETLENVEFVNNFLGENRSIEYSDEYCFCDYDKFVNIYLKTGEKMYFGIEKDRDGSLTFSRNSTAVIRFENINYDDFIEFIKAFSG